MSIFVFLTLVVSCASQFETPGPSARTADLKETKHPSKFFKRFGTRAQACIKDEECQAGHVCSSNGARGYGFCLISCKNSPCPKGLECTAVGDSMHGLAFDVCDTPQKKVAKETEEYFELGNLKGPLVDILFPRSLFPDDHDPENDDDQQPLPVRDE